MFPHYSTDCLFSPDDRLVVTGTSVKRGTGAGKLVFLDRQNLEVLHEIPVVDGEVIYYSTLHRI